MAFGQINTGFGTWFGSMPFSGWFTSGNTATKTSSTTKKTTTNKAQDYTYNSRYPGFDKQDYDRLVEIVKAQGVTGNNFNQLMDEAYQYYYPQVLNKHKLDERGAEINKGVYENWNNLVNGDPKTSEAFKKVDLAQKAKQKFGISYDMDDEELVGIIVKGIENGPELYSRYLKSGDPEIFYAAWIYDTETADVKQGGVKSLINPASEGGILPESAWELVNPVGAATETLDNAASKFADKLTVKGNNAAENLKKELDSMSQQEVEAYRKQYEQLLKDKDRRVATVEGNTIVGRLWNAVKGNLKYEYDDEEFMKWLISQKANLGQSLIGADDMLKDEHNPNVIKFFSNIPASAVKTLTATIRGMTNPYDTFKGLYKIAFTEEWHQAILDRYGSWDAFAEAINTDPVGVADDILAVAELGTNLVRWGMNITGKLTGNQSLITNASKIPQIGSANDALAGYIVNWGDITLPGGKTTSVKGIYGTMDDIAGSNKLLQWVNRYAQDVSNAGKLAQDAKDIYEAAKPAVKNFLSEVVTKTIGIDEADRKFIKQNADLVNEYLDGKKTVDTVYDDLKSKISEERLKNSEMGKQYDTLRKNKTRVVDTKWITQDMKKVLADNGITIDKDWNLKYRQINKFNAKQKAALEAAWDQLKFIEKKKNINAWNVLDMRQKFDDMLNWDGKAMDLNGDLSAVDKATESLIREMRGVIDNRAKTSVVWLKELDTKYGSALEDMQQIRKDWLNPDWTLKDSARSKLRNLTKAGNEERLARLEKLVPGITDDLKALDVGLTVQRATWQGVGQYAKGGLITAWITTAMHNPALGIPMAIAWVFATPKNFVKLIEMYPDIGNKIQLWIKLNAWEINRLEALASRIQDWVIE